MPSTQVTACTGRVASRCQPPLAGTISSHNCASGIAPVNPSQVSSAVRSSAVSAASSPVVVIANQALSSPKAVPASTAGVMIARFMRFLLGNPPSFTGEGDHEAQPNGGGG